MAGTRQVDIVDHSAVGSLVHRAGGRYDPASREAFRMNRRDFVTGLGAILGAPLAAEGQQAAKVPRIGFLSLNAAPNLHLRDAFRQGLRDLGYVEGRNVVIEYRDAAGQFERLPALAAELIARKVDVIVTTGGCPSPKPRRILNAAEILPRFRGCELFEDALLGYRYLQIMRLRAVSPARRDSASGTRTRGPTVARVRW